ncbi:MAG: leucine-rich repeat protein [Bacilli bacterium]
MEWNQSLVSIHQDLTIVAQWIPAYTYDLIDNQAIITGFINGYCPEIANIPDQIRGYVVVGISSNAFQNNSTIIEVIFPNTLTSIGVLAFSNTPHLVHFQVSDNHPTLSSVDGILYNKTQTILIIAPNAKTTFNQLPETLLVIGNGAFYRHSTITSIVIPSTVKIIDDFAFYECNLLNGINLPSSLEVIGGQAFFGCEGITSIFIPKSVNSIGLGALTKLINLTYIEVDNENQAYSSQDGILYDKIKQTILLYPAKKAEAYTFPSSVQLIGYYAFAWNLYLNQMIIPNGVTSIESGAFFGCTQLESLSFGKDIQFVGVNVFGQTTSLSRIDVSQENSFLVTIDGVLYNKNLTQLIAVPSGKEGELILQNSTTSIYGYAFNGSNLQTITIPDSVSSIGAFAFQNTKTLQTVFIDSLTPPQLGENVFVETNINIQIYVLTNLVNNYKIHVQWKTVANYIQPNPNFYTVTFNGNGGTLTSGSESQIIQHGAHAVAPIYNMDGYVPVFNKPLTYITEDTQIEVIWKQLYTITFDSQGGVGGTTQVSITTGSSMPNAEAPSRTDYIFQGYYTGTEGTGTQYYKANMSSARVWSIESDFTLYAYWLQATPGLVYSLNSDGTYRISGYNGDSSNVLIPQIYQGAEVTAIGIAAFKNKIHVTSITLPDTITSIGKEAFFGATEIQSIIIPIHVSQVGIKAFGNCTSLLSIEVHSDNQYFSSFEGVLMNKEWTTLLAYPGGKTTISYSIPMGIDMVEEFAFASNHYLESINISSSITQIHLNAFVDLSNLSKILVDLNCMHYKVMDGILYNFDQTILLFAPRKLLTEVVIPYGVIKINDYAFYKSTDLKSIEFSETITQIGQYAFANTTSLTSLILNEQLQTINSYAFYKSTSLTSITIPKAVNNIGTYVFYGCSSLTSFEITNLATTIGSNLLTGCFNLQVLKIPLKNTYNSGNNSYFKYYFGAINYSSNVVIPYFIDEIHIIEGVQAIPAYAFYNCNMNTTITLPSSITSIGNQAFFGCKSITSLQLPKNIDAIGNQVFMGMELLESIQMETGNTHFISIDGVLYDASITTLIAYPAAKETAHTIPTSVTSIASYAFAYQQYITSLVLEEQILSVGNFAFSHMAALTSISIGSNVNIIGIGAFSYNSKLEFILVNENNNYFKSVNGALYNEEGTIFIAHPGKNETTSFIESNTQIASYAFAGSNLISITIPSTITVIGENAFFNSILLQEVTMKGATPPSLGVEAFHNTSSNLKIFVYASVINRYQAATNWSTYNTQITPLYESFTVTFIYNEGNLISGDLVQTIEYGLAAVVPNFVNDGYLIKYDKSFDFITETTIVHVSWEFMFTYDVDNDEITITGIIPNRNIENAIIPNTHEGKLITKINNNAFSNNQTMKTIFLNEYIKEIGLGAFQNCSKLTSIYINDNHPLWASENGILMNKDKQALVIYPTGKVGVYEIPSGVIEISNYAFYGSVGLTEIYIRFEGLQTIGDYAFADCENLEKIDINLMTPPNIGNHVFENTNDQLKIMLRIDLFDIYNTHPQWSLYSGLLMKKEPPKIVLASTGDWFSIAITENGKIFSWGYNYRNRLALGISNSLVYKTPQHVTSSFGLYDDEKIEKLSSAIQNSILLTSKHRVFTWGFNDKGQLGNGSTSPSILPVDITSQFNLYEEEYIIDVDVNYFNASAITSLHRVFVWGVNYYSQLLDGTFTNSSVPLDITNKFDLNQADYIIKINGGINYFVALSKLGEVYTWGLSSTGRLGYTPSSGETRIPHAITNNILLLSDEKVIGLDCGDTHTIAYTSEGRLFSWGLNLGGELGLGYESSYQIIPSLIPFSLDASDAIKFLVVGGNSNYLFAESNRTFVWGKNNNNQLIPISNTTNINCPFEITNYLSLLDGELITTACTYDKILIVTSFGRLLGWGSNFNYGLAMPSDYLKVGFVADITNQHPIAFYG